MKKTILLATPYLVTALTFAGCGSSDNTGASASAIPTTTGVDTSKSLNTLTTSEEQQFCWQFSSTGATERRQSCLVASVYSLSFAEIDGQTDADLRDMCQVLHDDCMGAPGNEQQDTEACKAQVAACSATVGEYEACLTELSRALAEAVTGVPQCSALTAAYLQKSSELLNSRLLLLEDAYSSAACADFLSQCPWTDQG